MLVWGGSSDVAANIWAWYWAIGEAWEGSHHVWDGDHLNLSPSVVVEAVGCTEDEAKTIIADAEWRLRCDSTANRRSGAHQSLSRLTRKELRAYAERLGLKTAGGSKIDGYTLKTELVAALVDAERPLPGPRPTKSTFRLAYGADHVCLLDLAA